MNLNLLYGTPLFLLATLVPVLPALAAPAPQGVRVAQASRLPASASGRVVDARTGAPVAGALVQQDGAVTSAFTGPDGSFRLPLERGAGATVAVSAVGYEAASVPIGSGRGLVVSLGALAGFVPSGPAAIFAPSGTSAAETAPLNSALIFGYRLRRENQTLGAASTSGFADNDFALGLRFRYRPFLLEAEGSHVQYPVDVTGLPTQENPAYSPSTWQAGLRAGLLYALTRDLEAALALAYQYRDTTPNNNGVPYTGSDLDFEQGRHAVGGVGTLAWRPGRGPWHLESSLGLYPYVSAYAKSPGRPYAGSFLTDGRASVGYEFVPGLWLGATYTYENWTGGGSDTNHLFGLAMHYTPGGVPQGNEP